MHFLDEIFAALCAALSWKAEFDPLMLVYKHAKQVRASEPVQELRLKRGQGLNVGHTIVEQLLCLLPRFKEALFVGARIRTPPPVLQLALPCQQVFPFPQPR